MDREKVIKGLEYHLKELTIGKTCFECPYLRNDPCEIHLITNTLDLLKEQITTSTNESRIFHCKKCGYGIDDIFLSDEHNYQIKPRFCPNCGRVVK